MSAALRVAHAAETIRARWEQRTVESPQVEAAQALEDTGQLLNPEVVAELRGLRNRVAELKAKRADEHDELAMALGRSNGTEWGDLIEFAAGAVSVESKLRARIAELEALAAAATEYRVWEPGYGLYVRRSPGVTGFAILESRRTEHGRRAWTKAGLRYTVALSDADLYCWPDAESAVAEARRVLPGAVVREGEPAETGGTR